MSEINKFSEEGQEKIHDVVFVEAKSSTTSEEKVAPSEKVTLSEEF